jgi:outer membrane protein assembly factor BamB
LLPWYFSERLPNRASPGTTRLSIGGLLVLALGCGGQSVSHHSDSNAAGTSATGATSGSGDGGAAGRFSAAGAGNGGSLATIHAPPPDFDLTIEPDMAVAYMIDPAHTGAQPSATIDPPLSLLWSRRFDGAVSYPLVIGSRIFVTANAAGLRIPTLYALDAATGATLWQVTPFGTDPTSTSAELAYDRGYVFAADTSGHVAAFAAETGATAWNVKLDAYTFVSFPVAAGGAVFLVGTAFDGDYLYALNEADGSIVYRTSSVLGEPTLGDRLVFATSGCFETNALAIETGAEVWHYRPDDCFVGGDGRTGFWRNYLFAENSSGAVGVLDTVNGALFQQLNPPDVFWPMTFGQAPLAVEARDPDGATALVSYTGAILEDKVVPIDSRPRLPVLSTAHYGYALFAQEVTDPLNLAAIDPDTGVTAWQTTEKDAIPGDPEWNDLGGNPYPGIAAGSERIVIGVKRTVAAYASLAVK